MNIDFNKLNSYHNDLNDNHFGKTHKNNGIEEIAAQKIFDLKHEEHDIKLSFKKIKQKNKKYQNTQKKSVSRNNNGSLKNKLSNQEIKLQKVQSVFNYFERLKKLETKKDLEAFIQLFPKGGDTHCHLTGAIEITDYIKLAQEKKLRFTLDYDDKKNPIFTFYKPSEIGENSSQSSADFSSNSRLKKAFIGASTTCNGNNFFETFPNFESIDRHLALSDYLLPLLKRAYRANILYLEVSKGFEFNEWDEQIKEKFCNLFPKPESSEIKFYKKKLKKINLQEAFDYLSPHLNVKKNQYLAYLDAAEEYKIPRILTKKGFKNSLFSLDNPVVVRLNGDVNRELPLPEFFADLILAFLLVHEEINFKKNQARLLGVVLSGREFLTESFIHLKTHLKMIHFLRSKFLQVNCSLHAGELSERIATIDQMSSAIHPALKESYASSLTRIGHGTCILHDKKLNEILKVRKDTLPCFEICPTSNEIILGIKEKQHPLGFLLKNDIPFTLNTDDPGVLRTNLTNEFIKAVNWLPKDMNYEILKKLARNQIRYSFLPGQEIFKKKYPTKYKLLYCFKKLKLNQKNKIFLANSPKAMLQYRLEKSFAVFEKKILSQQKEVLVGEFLNLI